MFFIVIRSKKSGQEIRHFFTGTKESVINEAKTIRRESRDPVEVYSTRQTAWGEFICDYRIASFGKK